MQENEDLSLSRSVPVEGVQELQVSLCSGVCVSNNLRAIGTSHCFLDMLAGKQAGLS